MRFGTFPRGKVPNLIELRCLIQPILGHFKDHTAGNPQKEDVIWTDLSCTEIKEKLESKEIIVSRKIIKQLLSKHDYKKRKINIV